MLEPIGAGEAPGVQEGIWEAEAAAPHLERLFLLAFSRVLY